VADRDHQHSATPGAAATVENGERRSRLVKSGGPPGVRSRLPLGEANRRSVRVAGMTQAGTATTHPILAGCQAPQLLFMQVT